MKALTLFLLLAASCAARAQTPAPVSPQPGQILVTGTVADEASKAAVLARLRELYGFDRVVDQVAVGAVAVPANWNAHVQKLLTPNLKLITRGQLTIDGSSVSVRGEVANEAQRQQIASEIATSLNPTYTVNNGLRVAASEQGVLDAALDKRIIEFDSGQASITSNGLAILNEMAAAMQKLKGRKVEVIGHTDNTGLRASNVSLSQARADAVRGYLASKGIAPDTVLTSGQGPDRPVASNATADGRARNRRIEFRIAQ
ncbi:OmpA family protein [Janthinobacterium sp. PC23-8]|uniref:OmpA family protein n=1 Tax=Janthinobacterium sp. PC23-8 TaxID=2012679 RepID=UPI000B960F16|nr:OmpA family protein [Janthinobacterium sp. PC23-8]OYO32369.1 cell envelope biogenesis protein OmpA [Janthinobacterium sp. PC23-8]